MMYGEIMRTTTTIDADPSSPFLSSPWSSSSPSTTLAHLHWMPSSGHSATIGELDRRRTLCQAQCTTRSIVWLSHWARYRVSVCHLCIRARSARHNGELTKTTLSPLSSSTCLSSRPPPTHSLPALATLQKVAAHYDQAPTTTRRLDVRIHMYPLPENQGSWLVAQTCIAVGVVSGAADGAMRCLGVMYAQQQTLRNLATFNLTGPAMVDHLIDVAVTSLPALGLDL